MKRHVTNQRWGLRLLVAGLCLGVLSACSSGGSGGGDGGGEADERVEFDAFVRTLFDQTSETALPTEIEGIEFQFPEDPAAFDDLLNR